MSVDSNIRILLVEDAATMRKMELKILKQLGVEAAIVGKALYTGDIDLKQALAEVS